MAAGKEKRAKARPAKRQRRKSICFWIAFTFFFATLTAFVSIRVTTEARSYAVNCHNPNAFKVTGSFFGTSFYAVPDEYVQDVCTVTGYDDIVTIGEVLDVRCDDDTFNSTEIMDYEHIAINRTLKTTNADVETTAETVVNDNEGRTYENAEDDTVVSVIVGNDTKSTDLTGDGDWSIGGMYDYPYQCKSCVNRCNVIAHQRLALLNAKVKAHKVESKTTFNVTVPHSWLNNGRNLHDVACDYLLDDEGTISKLYIGTSGTRESVWFSMMLFAVELGILAYVILVLCILCICNCFGSR